LQVVFRHRRRQAQRVADAQPGADEAAGDGDKPRLRALRGEPEIRVIYDPRPGYAQQEIKTEFQPDIIKTYTAGRPYE